MSLVAVALVHAPAHAQEAPVATPTEPETKVRQCLEAVGKAGSDPRACVGVVADSCLEQPQNNSPDANHACIVSETKVWEVLLEDRYLDLRGLLSEEAGARVEQVQYSWAAYRDKFCELGTVVYEEEALVALWRANCMLEETGRRAIELGALIVEIKAR